MAKSKFIKSSFYTVPNSLLEANKVYVNEHEGIKYTSIAITEVINLSVGANAISKNSEGVVSLRLKLEKEDGSPRTYETYNKETKQTNTITVQEARELLQQVGLVEEEQVFNIKNIIPTR